MDEERAYLSNGDATLRSGEFGMERSAMLHRSPTVAPVRSVQDPYRLSRSDRRVDHAARQAPVRRRGNALESESVSRQTDGVPAARAVRQSIAESPTSSVASASHAGARGEMQQRRRDPACAETGRRRRCTASGGK